MFGTYTSPERVERDGRLIAFEGEEMTMDEAVGRGLVTAEKPKAKRAAKPKATAKEAEEKQPEAEAEEA